MKLYLFNKTLEERYEEYQSILLNSNSHEVFKVWKSYLSAGIETTGWDAQWCIPADMCQFLGILYPSYVLVTISDIDFEQLQATVEIKENIPNCELPDSFSEVALEDLVPLEDQDPAISLPMMDITALYLDQYRVFIKHLWWPWDEEEVYLVWADIHLRERLTLYYEMCEGKLLLETGTIIKDLLVEGKAAYQKILDLADSEQTETSAQIRTLMELSVRLEAVKKELSFYADEDLRRKLEAHNRASITHDWSHCLVVKAGTTFRDTAQLLEAASLPEDMPLAMGSDLQASIKTLFTDNTLHLGPGTWELSSGGMLELGGTLKGVPSSAESRPVLQDTAHPRASWLYFSFNETTLSNLCLHVKHKYGITVSKNAILNMSNVLMRGEGKQKGFQLKPGSTLLAQNCVFENLNTALVVMPGATVTLKQCVFTNNATALSILNTADITLVDCKFSSCSSPAVLVKNPKPSSLAGPASVDTLTQLDGFQVKDCEFEKNKVDVLVV